jgi:putative oxidoreductase
LVLRFVVGVGIMSHGWGKIQHPTSWMGPGAPTPAPMQAFAAIGEFFGGMGILFGALTPIAALGVAATMVGAILIGHKGAPWLAFPWLNLPKDAETWESAGSYLFPALARMLTGPGAFSIDALLFGRAKYDTSARSVTPPVKRRG